jgi:cell division transport system permease protein
LLHLGHTAITLLGTLFGIGLVAITFSTIRMQVLVGRAEIEVSQLLGASDHFIRRPFLYYGTLLALGGGLVASMLVAVAAFSLRSPLTELAQLYGLSPSLQPLSLRDSAMLLGSAAGLGWLGAVLSLHQYLYRP